MTLIQLSKQLQKIEGLLLDVQRELILTRPAYPKTSKQKRGFSYGSIVGSRAKKMLGAVEKMRDAPDRGKLSKIKQ